MSASETTRPGRCMQRATLMLWNFGNAEFWVKSRKKNPRPQLLVVQLEFALLP